MEEIVDAAALAIQFLGEAALQERAGQLVELAHDVMRAADVLGVPRGEIAMAATALQQADNARMLEAVVVLGNEAAALEQAASAQLDAVRGGAAHLARACLEHKRAADAMEAVRRAAAERAKQMEGRAAHGWWSRIWGRRRRRVGGIEEGLLAGHDEPAAATGPGAGGQPGQGDERRVAMQGYGLFVSVALLPYLGSETGVLKPFTDDDRWWISSVFAYWWTVVAGGAACRPYARNQFELQYAQISTRLAMLGVNIFVILFTFWSLAIEAACARNVAIGFAVVVHVFLWFLASRRGDL